MDRSLYPEGVEVHQADLARTEATKIDAILQRTKDFSARGVAEGGQVTINGGDATKVDLAAVRGYATGGEEVEVAVAQNAISLVDYTNGAKNYLCAFYIETQQTQRPHETNGYSYATEAVRGSRVQMLSAASLAALPTTDSHFDNNDLDRLMLLGVITARGVGVALQAADIVMAGTFGSAITATNQTNTITGVSIYQVDHTMPSGTGYLDYSYAAVTLRWKGPGESNYGTPVSVAVSGVYDLYSLAGKRLSVLVVTSALPGGANLTNTIAVTNIYAQTVPRLTAEDLQHRSMLGSGTPTATNPHGLTMADLGVTQGSTEIHQQIFHANGILRTSSAGCLSLSVNTATAPDTLVIQAPTAGDGFYLNGLEHNGISNPSLSFTDVGDNAQAIFDIYAVQGGNGLALIEKRERVRYATVPPPTLSQAVQLYDIHPGCPAGAAQLFYDDGLKQLCFKAPGRSAFGAGVALPSYKNIVRVWDDQNTYWIEVYVDNINGAGRWVGITGGGNKTENLTVAATPTAAELKVRLRLGAVMYSGSGTGYLGVGVENGSNTNNTTVDRRLFGTDGADNLRDDVPRWVTLPALGSLGRSWWYGLGTSRPQGFVHLSQPGGAVKIGYVDAPWTGSMSLEVIGQRNDTNSTFGGRIGLSHWCSAGAAYPGGILGGVYFGGTHGSLTRWEPANNLFSAAVIGYATETRSDSSHLGTALLFFTTPNATGGYGRTLDQVNAFPGREVGRFTETGSLLVGATTSPNTSGTHIASNGSQWPFVAVFDSTTASNRTHFLSLRQRNGGALLSGDFCGGLAMGGKYDGSNWGFGWNGGAEIIGIATENWTPTARGAGIVFNTTYRGGQYSGEKMRLWENVLMIGRTTTTATTTRLEVGGAILLTNASQQGQADASIHIVGGMGSTASRMLQMAPLPAANAISEVLIGGYNASSVIQWWTYGVDTDGTFKLRASTQLNSGASPYVFTTDGNLRTPKELVSLGSSNSAGDNSGTLRLYNSANSWMLRNDGQRLWVLATASNDPWGTWQATIPMSIRFSDMLVTINGVTIGGTGFTTLNSFYGTFKCKSDSSAETFRAKFNGLNFRPTNNLTAGGTQWGYDFNDGQFWMMGGGKAVMAVRLPAGVTLGTLSLIVTNVVAGSGCAISLWRTSIATGLTTTIADNSDTGVGTRRTYSVVLPSYVIGNDDMVYMAVTNNTGASYGIIGVMITYTAVDKPYVHTLNYSN